MAPEVALSKPYSHRAEVIMRTRALAPPHTFVVHQSFIFVQVFGWATVVWQMISHDRPFDDCDVAAFYRRVCHRDERPKIPNDTPPALASILKRCWDADVTKRPEFGEIIPILNALVGPAAS